MLGDGACIEGAMGLSIMPGAQHRTWGKERSIALAHMPPGAPIGPRHALVSLPKSNSDVRLHCVPPSHLSRKQLLVRANTIINVEAGRPDDIANPADFLLERYQVRAIANLRW